jgi:2-polyprenyl-3-methyl-5-hydroxy-6-metoxy-1,4-benzoquinol methylase
MCSKYICIMDLTQTENINCPLCESNDYKKKYTVNNWAIVKCDNCSFVYVNPRLNKKELFNIYNSSYFDNTVFGYSHYDESKDLRKKNFRKWIDDATGFFNKNEHTEALDIGCATGYCLEIFKEHGWKANGIELDKSIANKLNKKGYSVYNTSLLDTTFNTKFSIITLFDVVEHLTEIKENFLKLHNILTDDGIIIMITPDYQSLQRKVLGEKWFQFKPIEHINYFDLKSLQKVAAETGFEIIFHKKSGQYADLAFLKSRLQKYKLKFFLPLLNILSPVFSLQKRFLYSDTASLYLILKKK